MTGAPKTSIFQITGMDCAGCASNITTAVARLPGIRDVSVSVNSGRLNLLHLPEADLGRVKSTIEQLGYGAKEGVVENATSAPWWKSKKAFLTILCAVALALAYIVAKAIPAWGGWPFIAALLVGLVPIGRKASAAAANGSPFSIEMLMCIAAVGAVVIGATEEAAVVVLLFLVGELLEGIAASRARASIQTLTTLIPKTALVFVGKQTREMPADQLQPGMVILVRPGDAIPADGMINEGTSAIDEAAVTGESQPVSKGPGAQVFAGTINGDGALHVRVSAAAANNTIARIIKLVESAQDSKAPTARFIDRFSHYYTPAVVVAAAIVAVAPPLLLGQGFTEWIYKGLAILLIGCPCALVISTPAAIAASLSAGARRGLLLKGGAVLENLRSITAVAFDKTGTLTEGRPQVTDIVGFGRSEAEVLRLAAALEVGSSHPLASAILTQAKSDGVVAISAMGTKAIAGKGVIGRIDDQDIFLGAPRSARDQSKFTDEQINAIETLSDDGKSVSVLLVNGEVAGLIAMRDEPRADAEAGLRALAAMGLKTVMLTGDNQSTAQAVGKRLGIEVRAELLPEDKQRIVKELKAQGFTVAKIGDGINDAPALATADIGIAMGGGTDVALETADGAILHGRVGDVAQMINLSKTTLRNIHQNITIALGLKAVFLVTTIIGVTGLWPAILADTGATVLVTLNALRLLRGKAVKYV